MKPVVIMGDDKLTGSFFIYSFISFILFFDINLCLINLYLYYHMLFLPVLCCILQFFGSLMYCNKTFLLCSYSFLCTQDSLENGTFLTS